METAHDSRSAAHAAMPHAPRDERSAEGVELAPWVAQGLAAGALGAAVVAVLFLIVDFVQGRPLFTPAALGSALFLGEPLAADAPRAVLIAGYTAVHGTIFVAVGMLAAFLLSLLPSPPSWGFGAAFVAGLFAAYEITFLLFAALFMPQWAEELGAGWVAFANLLAALGMSGWLVRWARRRGVPLPLP